jgi:hypothetical protein
VKNRFFLPLRSAVPLALLVVLAFPCEAAAKASEKVIYSFNVRHFYPRAGLVSDSQGNLYGVASGTLNDFGCAAAFELSPDSSGTWVETTIYSFTGCGTSGLTPAGPLAMDKGGNLYGIEYSFSASAVLFELKKDSSGTWRFGIVHTFANPEGGPLADLTWDSEGNLYGATSSGFSGSEGEVFELSPLPNGAWTETVLYSFPAPDGVGYPQGGVTFDTNGNLYGSAFFGVGGSGSYGAVYELSPQASGLWTFTVIHNFTGGLDGSFPSSKMTFDPSGNLYGQGQNQSFANDIFELSPTSGGQWILNIVHVFTSGADGAGAEGVLAVDAKGNLYGNSYEGGLGCNGSLCGIVYELLPQPDGTWKEAILHPFESADDGSEPLGSVLLDSSGNLFGTTSYGGGRVGYGTVYEITP